MSDDVVLTEIDDRGVATVTLNRPDVHNAYNSTMIGRLRRGCSCGMAETCRWYLPR